MNFIERIKNLFSQEKKIVSIVSDDIRHRLLIKFNYKHEFINNQSFNLVIDENTSTFVKVSKVIDKKTIEVKKHIPGIYVYTNSFYAKESIYKVGLTNWQIVVDRIKQQDTTAVAEQLRKVAEYPLVVDNPNDTYKIEEEIHSRLNRVRERREFFKNDFSKEIDPTIKKVIDEYKSKKTYSDKSIDIPRYYQYDRIENASKHFKEFDRGWYQSACATGKTKDGAWIYWRLKKDELFKNGNGVVVVLVPSIYLCKQTLKDWKQLCILQGYNFRDLLICGDKDATESIENISSFLKESSSKSINLIISTYQSHRKLSIAIKTSKITPDLIYYDECHRITGDIRKSWNSCLLDTILPSTKKIFMTASPIFYTDDSVMHKGMNDENIFGKKFHEYCYRDAVDDGYVTPLDMYALQITNEDIDNIKNIINENKYICAYGSTENDSPAYATFIIQLHCALMGLKMGLYTHPVFFTNSISRAESFNEHLIYLAPKYGLDLKDKCFMLTGKDSVDKRMLVLDPDEKKYNSFSKMDMSVISNARCLQEGVSVNRIDGVGFVDPRTSIPDIIQICGRPTRLHKKKDRAVIIIPMVFEKNEEEKIVLDNNYWSITRDIICNLIASDEYFSNVVESNNYKMITSDLQKKGIETIKAIVKAGKKNISGKNIKIKSSGTDWIPEIEIKLKDLIRDIKIEKYVESKVTRKSDIDTIDKYLKEYVSDYIHNIDRFLRDFNSRSIKIYSKYCLTKEQHIKNISQQMNISEIESEKKLNELDFFNKINNKQKELEKKILILC